MLAKADIDNARAMASRLAPGAVVLLDRHYNSLLPYHRGVPNIYAVWTGTQCAIRYVSVSSGRIILQPDSRIGQSSWWRSPTAKASPSTSSDACATLQSKCEGVRYGRLRIPSWVRASCEDAWVAALKWAA